MGARERKEGVGVSAAPDVTGGGRAGYDNGIYLNFENKIIYITDR